MNLSQLRFASAVASGVVHGGGRGCTQLTLSNGIAQLENELGRLFVALARSLTPFGVHVPPYINEVLSAR
jgi:DNA-binding transcriptional LysR family regulator